MLAEPVVEYPSSPESWAHDLPQGGGSGSFFTGNSLIV